MIIITKVKVYITYTHVRDDDSLKIQFRAWLGLIKYTVDIPLIKIDDDSPSLVVEEEVKAGSKGEVKNEKRSKITPEDLVDIFSDMKTLLEHVVSLHRMIRHFLKKVTVKNIEWRTVVGTGDAALTGMLTGAVWTVKGSIVGIMSHYFRFQAPPNISVHPHFQMAVSQTLFTCMLHFRIGHAMIAGIKLVKFWKGGRPQFKSRLLSTISPEKTNSV
jgi:hypothetical protein